jgi:rare lipoprotein A
MKKIQLPVLIVFLLITLLCTAQKHVIASYYSHKLEGRHTTDGGIYHPDSMTCAHRTYPFGTLILVKNPKNDKQVVVKVTDRGPYQRRLSIDLSYAAAKKIGIIGEGIAKVVIQKIDFLPFEIPSLLPIPVATFAVTDNIKTDFPH